MRIPQSIHDKGVKDVLAVLKAIQPAGYYLIDRKCTAEQIDIMPYPSVILAHRAGLVDKDANGRCSLNEKGLEFLSS
jgi:hypothetical protein